jgi:penicillin-binding protein 2
MVKVGPAFFDYVSTDKIKIRKSFGDGIPRDVFVFAPMFLLIIVSLLIVIRLFYIQVLRGSYYANLSDANRTKTEIVPAPRGIIYDRAGRPLVVNSPIFRINQEGKTKTVGRDEALSFMAQNKKVTSVVRRDYLYKDTFAHVLGYVGNVSEEELSHSEFAGYSLSDYVGKMGLERQYEKILHGKNGKSLFEVDSKGNIIRELGKEEPVAGESIKTTLDLDVQLSVKEAFSQADRGAVVVSDPRTGGILALYSKSSFDPNIFTHDDDYKVEGEHEDRESILSDTERQPLLDRSISGTYPPGSTFKLITAVAALEKGVIKPDTEIEDTGILRVGEFSFGNWYFLQYGRKEGYLDVVGAIKRSNDIFFYKAAEGAGVERISSFAKDFGLGGKFGIDIPGEADGIVPSPSWKEENIHEQWYLGDTYNYGIGQGYLLTTPLQVNVFTSVFANGGTLYKPHLLETRSRILKQDFIKDEYINLVREGMRQSCEAGGVAFPFFDFKVKNDRLSIDGRDFVEDASGSAKMVRVKVGCKTGTAEVGGEDTKPHAWITVFAPYEKPEIVVTVLVENGGEGSSVAGPIAKKILQDYFEKR